MSKHQKGRRHRTVNRSPRPAGPARPPAAPRTPAAPAPAAGRTAPAAEPIGTPPAARQQPAAPDAPRSSEGAADAGLGHHAVRTWQEVRSAGDDGITVDELCTAVGYQSRTILKHLKVLAQDGLAEADGERWRSTGKAV
ncbi:hypothetical protein ABZ721_26675 [Streptomyces sp. NPDC006733]|uniref:hypothetical protein n=1 Tax=Streptomyces sp. NPDC006733 TaxID=3155460 RepID=UPI0033D27E24